MSESDKKFKLKKQMPAIRRMERLHPHKMLAYIMILASSIVFVFYLMSFLKLSLFDFGQIPSSYFPRFFSVSTILLTTSMAFSTKIMNDYFHDNIKKLRISLSLIMIAGLLFIIIQSLAWLEILNMESEPDIELLQNYLYLFSGLHLIHILAGLILATYLFYRIVSVEGDPVKSLILLTNPYEKILLEIFTIFWHYLIILWIVIYLVLLLVY